MKKLNLLLILIFFVGFFLRFYALGQVPSGLTNDESDIGYDAYSILLTGRDQWGKFMPVTSFRGFGDFRPVLYTYLVVPFIRIFDLNAFSVRLPSAIFGTLTIIPLYFLTKKLFDGKTALGASLLFSISPWSIGLSRIGIESNVAIFLVVSALLFFVKFSENRRYLYVSAIILALSVYMYSAYFLFSFLVFLVCFAVYARNLLKHKKELFLACLIFMLLISPILINRTSASSRFSQVGLTTNINSIGLVTDLNATRGACLKDYMPIVCKLVDNKPALFLAAFSRNYLTHFSPAFLYFNGNETQYSIIYKRGLEYSFEVILFFAGLVFFVKTRKNSTSLILLLLLASAIPDSFTGDGNYSRASIMIPFLTILEACGAIFIVKSIKFEKKWIYSSLVSLCCLILVFSVASFFITYTTYFKNNYSSFSQYGYEELMRDLYSKKDDYDEIYVTRHLNDAKQYSYYLFYNKYEPSLFQSKSGVSFEQGTDGWVDVNRIGNIHFVGSLNQIHVTPDLLSKRVLFVAHPTEYDESIMGESDIKDKMGSVKFKEVSMKELSLYLTSKTEIVKK